MVDHTLRSDSVGSASQAASGEAAAAQRPLTILQTVPKLNAGGVERGALEIAAAVVAAGGRAIVASEGGRMEARFRQAGAELAILPMASKNPAVIWLNGRRLERIIRREGVDLVHARSRAPAWSALQACRACKVPFVTTYHGAYNEPSSWKRRYNSVMAKGDAVIAISQFIADLIMQRYDTPRERITIIPRGADLRVFSEDKVSRPRLIALAEAWGVADDTRPVVMLPGRLTRWKGQMLFIDAVARLRDRRGADSFLALIVGGEEIGDRFGAELQQQILAAGLEDCTRMVGHCDDMAAALRLAAVAVSASLEPEAFGRVAVEAQAMGVPVVASAHGGACETVEDGVTGWWFTPGDPESLAETLDKALSLPDGARRSMGRAAAAHVRRSFTVEQMQKSTLALYQRVAGRRFGR